MQERLPLDFPPLHFSGEAIRGKGEDSWTFGFSQDAGMIAVFDGCGGSGARKHADYAGHSEAYMAARLCAGAVYQCMHSGFPGCQNPGQFAREILAPHIRQVLQANRPPREGDGMVIKGMRVLPSTMAAALIQNEGDGTLRVSPIWAGDSRVYVLDATGLSQLTRDDSTQPDPQETLYDDGALTNVLCADKPVNLHCTSHRLKTPFLLIAATDGCFGYVSTPMEFEGMLLHALQESDSVARWEEDLLKLVAGYAGDDHTLCLASFGYGSFEQIKRAFAPRYRQLCASYLETVWSIPWEDRDTRRQLWRQYRPQYMRFLNTGGQ